MKRNIEKRDHAVAVQIFCILILRLLLTTYYHSFSVGCMAAKTAKTRPTGFRKAKKVQPSPDQENISPARPSQKSTSTPKPRKTGSDKRHFDQQEHSDSNDLEDDDAAHTLVALQSGGVRRKTHNPHLAGRQLFQRVMGLSDERMDEWAPIGDFEKEEEDAHEKDSHLGSGMCAE